MATLDRYLYEGNRTKKEYTDDGRRVFSEIERVALVSGCSGADSKEQLVDAIAACPDLFSLYDGLGMPGLRLCEIEPELIEPTVCKVRLRYKLYKPVDDQLKCQIRVGAAGENEETNIDNTGNPIVLKYSYLNKREKKDWPNPGIDPQEQSGIVQRLMPRPQISITRMEGTSPFDNACIYVGTVNNNPVWGKGARTLLCVAIDGTSEDGGGIYNVSYTFEYNKDTHDVKVIFIDPLTGKPPTDVGADGKKVVKIYPQTNFELMGLTLSL